MNNLAMRCSPHVLKISYEFSDRNRSRKFSTKSHDKCSSTNPSNQGQETVITCNWGSTIVDYKAASFTTIPGSKHPKISAKCNYST